MNLITEKLLSESKSKIYDFQRNLKIGRFNVEEEYIYKYINLGGLKGMITNHEIWASNSKFMNDFKEFEHGIDNFNLLISEIEKKEKKSVDLFKKMIRNKEENNQKFSRSYISCFSTKKDMLSQWRAYGSFSVEFEVSRLKEMFDNSQCKFNKISYIPRFDNLADPEKLKYLEDIKLFESLITLYEKTAKHQDNSPEILKNQLVNDQKNNVFNQDEYEMQSLETTLDEILISFKHIGFEEEKEVRLLYLDNEEWLKKNKIQKQKIEIREQNIPYIKIKNDNEKLPITSIYISPISKNDVDELKCFLTNSGYGDVEIIPSEIPLRSDS